MNTPYREMRKKGKSSSSPEDYYNSIAELYDSGKKKNLYYFDNLVNLYSSLIPAKSSITEIGCGTGDLITKLDAKIGLGIDLSEKMVQVAKNKHKNIKNITYQRSDIFDSNDLFPSDNIIMADVLEHVVDLPRFLGQIYRRTKSHGKVIISLVNPIWEPILMVAEKLDLKIPEGPHKRFSVRQMYKLYTESGFIIQDKGYRLLIPKQIPFSDTINANFHKNKLLARFGMIVYWILSKPDDGSVQQISTGRHGNISNEQVSFVFPVYNEEHVIEKTLSSYYYEFKGKLDFEMIVAEDGSTDQTKHILRRLATTMPIRLHMSDNRKGYLNAIKDALSLAQHKWIFLADSDHQFDPHDFWRLWPFIDKYDIILGIKTNRKDGFLRSFLSNVYNLLLRIIFHVPHVDMDTGFRLFRKTVSDRLTPTIDNLGYFTAEFVIIAHKSGYRILEIPVKHFKQQIRKSNIFHLNKLPFIVIRELRGIFHLHKKIRKNRGFQNSISPKS